MAPIASASSGLSSPVAAAVGRLAGLRAWMARHDLGAVYVTRPVSIAYLTGFSTDPHERLMALAVGPDRATLIVPAIEHENAVRQQEAHADVVSWRDGEDPHRLVSDALVKAARIGVEKDHLTLLAAEGLRSRAGARDLVDVAPEIRRLRRTKSPAEVQKLARAAAITDAVTDEVIGRLSAGMSELAVANLLGASINAQGANLSFDSSVQSGTNSAVPHHRPSGRVLSAGDLLLLDFGAEFEGYHADTTRMAVVGAPSSRQADMHALVLRAHDAALAAVRAGTTTGAVDAAAREVIEAAGLGDRFFHRTGHGLGLEIHEDPSLDPGSTTVLEAGMAMTVEPGVYFPGWGGVRIEDDVIVEATGCRVLTRADRSLRIIAAH
jgi:Xaa-Pro aminopeptidase